MSEGVEATIKFLDGEPWEVAIVAGNRVDAAYSAALETLEEFEWAARGAWMSQEYHRTGQMPKYDEFTEAPLGRSIANLKEHLEEGQRKLLTLVAAAGFDPRSY